MNKIDYVFENKILYGLSSEWDLLLWVLSVEEREMLNKPFFSLSDMTKTYSYWSFDKREICFSRKFVYEYSWEKIRDVLLHEIAHQYTHEVLNEFNETPHGPAFKKACHKLRANPKASENYTNTLKHHKDSEKKVIKKIRKLFSLAQSSNQNEAESAMNKAYELLKKHHIHSINDYKKKEYSTRFIGKPALRHFKEEYYLADILQKFYFISGIWISTHITSKGKSGRVLEISGTAENVEIASYVYDFIKNHIDIKWTVYKMGKGLNRYRKTDFAIGIIQGFRSKLEQKEKQSDTQGLILVKDTGLATFMNYKYPNIVKQRGKKTKHDMNVMHEGSKIGKKLVISKGISRQSGEITFHLNK